jgi:tripartite-type tricarboxylate transporter receptor subunit TctC
MRRGFRAVGLSDPTDPYPGPLRSRRRHRLCRAPRCEKASEGLGQNIIIENKAGAGGLLALEELVRAKPDGYTLMIGNVSTNAITPIIFKHRMKFDYEQAVIPVARLLVTPSVFIANANFPANNWQEFVDYAKKNPGKVRASSTGIGSFVHFDLEVLQKRLGLKMIHVPYREGAGGAIQGAGQRRRAGGQHQRGAGPHAARLRQDQDLTPPT